ncbi:TPA: DUF551 domain-containing protein [Escherichia coli]|uniref:DUF551 domain-containing protein n=1 Tax=Escherichia coli TaxID=562 RepID=A0A828P7B4_ECOLX|nr:DUF551 domain-containing protein [Escherichia coli]EFM8154309.1 DUF551 domain-containing protein [Escherichia coli]EGT1037456.1 DUF551 domain-containing protein [Escherichia coli]EHL2367387.1 DUF551 domain-containing protein [Escherichia coli]EKN9617728.1 DUF551 domain-containing protein [Escherichia coli]
MTTITKERLQWLANISGRDDIDDIDGGEIRELAQIALASLEAKTLVPVMYKGMKLLTKEGLELIRDGIAEATGLEAMCMADALLSGAPAPVVPDERAAFNSWNNDENLPIAGVGAKNAAWLAWQARAELGHSLVVNYPVTPDSWISCSERMPAQDDWILIYSKHSEYMAGQVQGEYVELSDGTLSWLGNALYWMPLPEPPKEVRQ